MSADRSRSGWSDADIRLALEQIKTGSDAALLELASPALRSIRDDSGLLFSGTSSEKDNGVINWIVRATRDLAAAIDSDAIEVAAILATWLVQHYTHLSMPLDQIAAVALLVAKRRRNG